MTSVYITLNSIEKVKNFTNFINRFDGNFDLSSDRYIVDAKSIMGIFSLDLTKQLKLSIINETQVDEILRGLEAFQADN